MIGLINNRLSVDINIEEWKRSGMAYEVIRVVDSKPLFLREHLLRLKKSIGDADLVKLKAAIDTLIKERDEIISQNIFLGYNLETGDNMVCFNKSFYPPVDWYDEGIAIGLLDIKRENPNFKIYNDKYKVLVKSYLEENDFFETLICSEGYITEGSRSNVFFIKSNKIITPPLKKVLPGITREKVFLVADDLGYEIEEKNIEIESLDSFDGVFITGTSIDLLPVKEVADKGFNTCSNKIYEDLSRDYRLMKKRDLDEYA